MWPSISAHGRSPPNTILKREGSAELLGETVPPMPRLTHSPSETLSLRTLWAVLTRELGRGAIKRGGAGKCCPPSSSHCTKHRIFHTGGGRPYWGTGTHTQWSHLLTICWILWKVFPWKLKACSNKTLSSTVHSSGKGVKLGKSANDFSILCLCQKSIPRA